MDTPVNPFKVNKPKDNKMKANINKLLKQHTTNGNHLNTAGCSCCGIKHREGKTMYVKGKKYCTHCAKTYFNTTTPDTNVAVEAPVFKTTNKYKYKLDATIRWDTTV